MDSKSAGYNICVKLTIFQSRSKLETFKVLLFRGLNSHSNDSSSKARS